ncbi:MAG: ABC-F family ATP-binding cassette domain-containing protein [Neomegalonema sp.]|nr:ABC-F family ATP-binding cassette domain-containing protein [Neomegalonema sp.]
MLVLRQLSYIMAGRPLFEEADATIPAGARVGVVGRNGAGKSTLFRLIRGELTPDGGEIEAPKSWRVGGVAQEAPARDDSLVDIVLEYDQERAALLAEAETASDPTRIADIQTRLADIGAHSAEARAASILAGLGFDAAAQARPSSSFSGGWRMRVALAGALFAAPDLLLLDEPTNYLDLEGTVWLEGFLARYPRTVLLISHDRGLLNASVNGILHLSNRKLAYYSGAFEQFAAERRARMAQEAAQAKRQTAERERIQSFVDRFRAKATKARQAQSRLKLLEKMEPISVTAEEHVAGFSFPSPAQLAPPLVRLDMAAVGYGESPVLSGLNLRIDADDRIALLGANGQGKSTLAKLIAGRMQPMVGAAERHSKLKVGFFAQHQLDDLVADETPVQHLQARLPDLPPAQIRSRLAAAGLGPETAETDAQSLSGGQKARLLMALAVLEAPNLLILDEPTNHLDMESRDALCHALLDYDGAVILISHDPHLVERVADQLWLVAGGKVAPFEGDMAAYKARILSERSSPSDSAKAVDAPAVKTKRRSAADIRQVLKPLRADVAKAEERVMKLEEMREEVEKRLADPALYDGPSDKMEKLAQKRGEILEGLARAEEIWEKAAAKLEETEAELNA